MIRLLLSLLLLPVLARSQEIPCPKSAEQVAGFEWFAVPAGCPVPIAGALYTLDAHRANAAEIAGLEQLVVEKSKRLDATRSAHDATRRWCAGRLRSAGEQLEAVSADLEAVADPPSRLVWAGIGAGGAVVAAILAVVLVP